MERKKVARRTGFNLQGVCGRKDMAPGLSPPVHAALRRWGRGRSPWPQPAAAQVGFSRSGWRLKSAASSESTGIQTTRPQTMAKRTSSLARQRRNEFSQRQKVVKQVKCLLGGKKGARADRHTGWARRESRAPPGSLNHFYGACLPGFLWPPSCFS